MVRKVGGMGEMPEDGLARRKAVRRLSVRRMMTVMSLIPSLRGLLHLLFVPS